MRVGRVRLVAVILFMAGGTALINAKGTRQQALAAGIGLVFIAVPLLLQARIQLGRTFSVAPQAMVLVTQGLYSNPIISWAKAAWSISWWANSRPMGMDSAIYSIPAMSAKRCRASCATTGFSYSGVEKSMAFAAVPGTYFWSNGYAWGQCDLIPSRREIQVRLASRHGEVSLRPFNLREFGLKDFEQIQTLRSGEELHLTITSRSPDRSIG